jgi:hypothetical protein
MKIKILRYLIVIISLGLCTASVWADSPNPTVTVSGVTYKGPNPNVTVSTVVYKGKDISVGKSPSMKISVKRNFMNKQVKIVLLSPVGKTFKVGAQVPLKVNVINPPEAKSEPAFEFQLLNGRIWRRITGQRVTGNAVKRFKDKITLTRYAQFRKAGEYRWRCRINRGAWSVWSIPVNVLDSGTRATPARSNSSRRE